MFVPGTAANSVACVVTDKREDLAPSCTHTTSNFTSACRAKEGALIARRLTTLGGIPMECPVCRTPLAEREVEGVRLRFCPGCGGILSDKEVFRTAISSLHESGGLEGLSTAELFERRAIPQRKIRPEAKLCPLCGETMSPFNYAYDSNIILDRCAKCEAIWADKGEIIKVAQYVKGNPALERLGLALAEREEERAKLQDRLDQLRDAGRGRAAFGGFWFGLVPISDEEETASIPLVTVLIILLNVAIFLILPQTDETFWRFGFIPELFFAGRELSRIITSEFVHIGFLHLAGNMLFLWIFGDNVEDRMGKIRFPAAYLLFGIGASITHAFLTSDPGVPCVGSSGAISGVMGAYFILFPQATVRTMIGHWQAPVPAFVYLGAWFLMQLLFSSFDGAVAYFAHIGGFATGVIAALVYKGVKKPGTA